MIGFFDHYSCFFRPGDGATSNTQRLNVRWLGMIGAQRDALAGKRVLEAGCYNGRWLLAALRAGAHHVVGIELYPELADEARRNLDMLGIPPDRYTIVVGDFFECARGVDAGIDTLLVPGFVDNAVRNVSIFDYFAACPATRMIYDEWIVPDDEAIIKLYQLWHNTIHCVPSAGALAMLARCHSLIRSDDVDYSAILGAATPQEKALFSSKGLHATQDDPIIDYKVGARITCRFTKQAARPAE